MGGFAFSLIGVEHSASFYCVLVTLGAGSCGDFSILCQKLNLQWLYSYGEDVCSLGFVHLATIV